MYHKQDDDGEWSVSTTEEPGEVLLDVAHPVMTSAEAAELSKALAEAAKVAAAELAEEAQQVA